MQSLPGTLLQISLTSGKRGTTREILHVVTAQLHAQVLIQSGTLQANLAD